MGRLRIMDREGDRQIEWSHDDPASLLMTAHELEQWIAQPGHLAFGFKRLRLDEGEKIDSFDPEVAEIILVPQMRGG